MKKGDYYIEVNIFFFDGVILNNKRVGKWKLWESYQG